MKIKKMEDGQAAVIAAPEEWATLGKLIDWLRCEHSYMDKATLLLDDEEITPALAEWEKATYEAMTAAK